MPDPRHLSATLTASFQFLDPAGRQAWGRAVEHTERRCALPRRAAPLPGGPCACFPLVSLVAATEVAGRGAQRSLITPSLASNHPEVPLHLQKRVPIPPCASEAFWGLPLPFCGFIRVIPAGPFLRVHPPPTGLGAPPSVSPLPLISPLTTLVCHLLECVPLVNMGAGPWGLSHGCVRSMIMVGDAQYVLCQCLWSDTRCPAGWRRLRGLSVAAQQLPAC